MPSAPLFYQPLVQARVLATPIAKPDGTTTTVLDAQQAQSKLVNEAYQNPKFRPKMDAIMRGFEGLQAGMPGSKTLDNIQFAFDGEGYVGNRVATAMRLHPNLFDTASPDQAAEIGAKLVVEAQKELAENPGMRAVGDTLEVAPDAAGLLKAHWEGEELGANDVAYLGVTAARELQRAVSPLDPDSTHPQVQWIEDATMWTLGMWPGAASRTAEALGLKADAKQVEEIVTGWRGNMAMVEPKVEQPMKSLAAILGAAGITVNDDTAYDAAFQVLQSSPLDGVPAAIAQAIVATNELPADQVGYFGGRIVETGGSAGNVKGLLAEIELAKRPPPVDPPGEPTKPGEEPPPSGPPPGEEPPGTDPKPPVDPPGDDGATTPDDGATKPDDVEAKLDDAAPADVKPMDDAEFAKLLAEVQAEIDAEQGPHPVNDPAVNPEAGADAAPAPATDGHDHAH